jgi:RNA polymerase sigma-70 factor (ECF subfamily)
MNPRKALILLAYLGDLRSSEMELPVHCGNFYTESHPKPVCNSPSSQGWPRVPLLRVPLPSAQQRQQARIRRGRDAALPHLDAVYTLARYLLRGPRMPTTRCRSVISTRSDARTSSPWLLAILCNGSGVEYGRQSRVLLYDADVEQDQLQGAIPLRREAPDTPETQVSRKLDFETIRRLVAALPDVFREVIVLREIDDLLYREIAAIVDAPVGTVMSRLARGRARPGSRRVITTSRRKNLRGNARSSSNWSYEGNVLNSLREADTAQQTLESSVGPQRIKDRA